MPAHRGHVTKLSSLIGWASKTLRNDPQNRIRVRIRVRVRVRARVRVRVRFRVKSPFRYKLQATISTSGSKNRRYFLLMSADGLGTKWGRNIAEKLNRLSRMHERYRQTDDDRQIFDGILERNVVTFG